MKSAEWTKPKLPKGFKAHGGTKVAVRFTDTLFGEIRERAEREGKSFGQMVGILCALGINQLEKEESEIRKEQAA